MVYRFARISRRIIASLRMRVFWIIIVLRFTSSRIWFIARFAGSRSFALGSWFRRRHSRMDAGLVSYSPLCVWISGRFRSFLVGSSAVLHCLSFHWFTFTSRLDHTPGLFQSTFLFGSPLDGCSSSFVLSRFFHNVAHGCARSFSRGFLTSDRGCTASPHSLVCSFTFIVLDHSRFSSHWTLWLLRLHCVAFLVHRAVAFCVFSPFSFFSHFRMDHAFTGSFAYASPRSFTHVCVCLSLRLHVHSFARLRVPLGSPRFAAASRTSRAHTPLLHVYLVVLFSSHNIVLLDGSFCLVSLSPFCAGSRSARSLDRSFWISGSLIADLVCILRIGSYIFLDLPPLHWISPGYAHLSLTAVTSFRSHSFAFTFSFWILTWSHAFTWIVRGSFVMVVIVLFALTHALSFWITHLFLALLFCGSLGWMRTRTRLCASPRL